MCIIHISLFSKRLADRSPIAARKLSHKSHSDSQTTTTTRQPGPLTVLRVHSYRYEHPSTSDMCFVRECAEIARQSAIVYARYIIFCALCAKSRNASERKRKRSPRCLRLNSCRTINHLSHIAWCWWWWWRGENRSLFNRYCRCAAILICFACTAHDRAKLDTIVAIIAHHRHDEHVVVDKRQLARQRRATVDVLTPRGKCAR